MPRFIIECEDPADIILGMRLIKRIMADGSECGWSEFVSSGKEKLWTAHKTKTGYSARDVNYVMGKREEK